MFGMNPHPSPTPMRAVQPLPGAAPYIGGKRNLARTILARLDRMPHTCYAEPFVGMGGIFFRRRTAPPSEIINDASADVATFFRVLQRHYVPFIDTMKWTLTTRAEFERLVATDPDTLTDLERSARFYYLQRIAFGGKVTGRNFGVCMDRGARFDITRLAPELAELHARLAGVIIEKLHYADFLTRYDRPTTLFYLDPPYYGSESDYGRTLFSRDDFERLSAQLAQLKARWLLSLNDVPDVRRIFDGFSIESVRTTYSVGGGARAKTVGEILITPRT